MIKLATTTSTTSTVKSSSKPPGAYILHYPTVAPSNQEHSKRQGLANEKNKRQFFLLEEDDKTVTQKVLKRKVPIHTSSTISTVRTTQSNHRNTNSASRNKSTVIHHITNSLPLTSAQQKAQLNNSNQVQMPGSLPHSSSTNSLSSTSSSPPQITSVSTNVGTMWMNNISNLTGNDTEQNANQGSHPHNNMRQPPSSLSPTTTPPDKANDIVAWVKMDEQELVKDFDTNLSGLGLELGANAYSMTEVLNLPIFKQDGEIDQLNMDHENNQELHRLPPLQYMLCAPTSPATKIHEETLTYLNQGQSYEMRLKKLRDIPSKLVKSFIRVVFHDRRLQYTEHQQFESWKYSRPNDRLLNLDVPMSVGVISPKETNHLNVIEFLWDVDKGASAFIKVHCISTEFTAKKHGGEKGVPFRIKIDTYKVNSNGELLSNIHAASCQIKVFKPKGADRKQKTDKDKMERRSAEEKLKYQQAYDSTLLTECMPTERMVQQNANEIMSNQIDIALGNHRQSNVVDSIDSCSENGPMSNTSDFSMENQQQAMNNSHTPSRVNSINSYNRMLENPSCNRNSINQVISNSPSIMTSVTSDILTPSASEVFTQQWLQRNRFSAFSNTFVNFGGADMLSLSRDDLIQICGPADGIRLYNALRSKPICPRLTLYLAPALPDGEAGIRVYRAFYLEVASAAELIKCSASLFEQQNGGGRPLVTRALYQPAKSNAHVLVTDEVVNVMKDESSFTVMVVKNESDEGFQVILKP